MVFDPALYGHMQGPILTFTLLITVILIIPPLFERLRLPGLIGLLVAGVVLGQSGLGWLEHKSETMELLSGIGKVYLMFVAGLEIDLRQFRKSRDRSLGFGFLTFIVPMVTGIILGRLFDFSWNASVLIGSLLASHTLLAYPIVSQIGAVANEAVMVTIGATIFTDTAALLVLAICVGIHTGDFNALGLAQLLIGLGLYSIAVLFGFDWAGKAFFRRTGDAEGNQFLFILLALFIASVGAQAVGVEQIVGAFLAGLAVNDVLGNSPVKEKVEFVGSVLFIPCFFVDMGLLINLPAFLKTLSALWLTLAIVSGLIGSKFLAALIAKGLYRYNTPELLTMWSLSLPQVAATLAATLVSYETFNPAGERLVNEGVLNSVIVLMVVTSILGPLITARSAPRLTLQPSNADLPTPWLPSGIAETDGLTPGLDASLTETLTDQEPWPSPRPHSHPNGIQADHPQAMASEAQASLLPGSASPLMGFPFTTAFTTAFTIVVPIYNPKTQRFLLEMAALIAQHENGRVIPVAIAKAPAYLDHPQLDILLERNRKRLQEASEIGQSLNLPTQPIVRLDDDVAVGISRVSREQNAQLIIMGWARTTGFRARLFGNVIDSVICASHCPVAVTRLLVSPKAIQRILVPINDFMPATLRTLQLAQVIADVNPATLILLYIGDPKLSSTEVADLQDRLHDLGPKGSNQGTRLVQIEQSHHTAEAIIRAAESVDLVMMHTVRYRTTAGLAVSEITTQIIRSLDCSLILLGDPEV